MEEKGQDRDQGHGLRTVGGGGREEDERAKMIPGARWTVSTWCADRKMDGQMKCSQE